MHDGIECLEMLQSSKKGPFSRRVNMAVPTLFTWLPKGACKCSALFSGSDLQMLVLMEVCEQVNRC